MLEKFNELAKPVMEFFGFDDKSVDEQYNNIIAGGGLGILGSMIGGSIGGSLGMLICGAAASWIGGQYGDQIMKPIHNFEPAMAR